MKLTPALAALVLATCATLLHSHDDEQPFTRDVYGVYIPPGIKDVVIRAHHSVKGYGGETLALKLPAA